MRRAAGWAGVAVVGAAQMTVQVIRTILDAMLRVLRPIATQALFLAGTSGVALPLVIAGASAVSGSILG